VTAPYGRLFNDELHNLYSSPSKYYNVKINENAMRACSTHEEDKKCVQKFGCKAWG
jgi:hypothetical protein